MEFRADKKYDNRVDQEGGFRAIHGRGDEILS